MFGSGSKEITLTTQAYTGIGADTGLKSGRHTRINYNNYHTNEVVTVVGSGAQSSKEREYLSVGTGEVASRPMCAPAKMDMAGSIVQHHCADTSKPRGK